MRSTWIPRAARSAVAAAVGFERRAVGMERVAIDLDGEPLSPLEEVDLISMEPNVRLRGAQAGASRERQKPLLRHGPREGREGFAGRNKRRGQ
jgi:hypothetical protein